MPLRVGVPASPSLPERGRSTPILIVLALPPPEHAAAEARLTATTQARLRTISRTRRLCGVGAEMPTGASAPMRPIRVVATCVARLRIHDARAVLLGRA